MTGLETRFARRLQKNDRMGARVHFVNRHVSTGQGAGVGGSAGGTGGSGGNGGSPGSDALRSKSGWSGRPGLDLYGFNAQPVGFICTPGSTCGSPAQSALFWTSTPR
jgi:hypothetical protein